MNAATGPPGNGAGARHGETGAGQVATPGGDLDTSNLPLRTVTAAGITKLLNARCVDCNGRTVGDAQAILHGFCLFLTRHAATCPMWGERARRHGIGRDDVLVHPLGQLAGDEDVLVYLADAGDGVCDG